MATKRTIFISRAGADKAAARQIGAVLEALGHKIVLQDWDFTNRLWLGEMDKAVRAADRVLVCLSQAYLDSEYCALEWLCVMRDDPLNKSGKILVCKVADYHSSAGLLDLIARWNVAPILQDAPALKRVLEAALSPAARVADQEMLARYQDPAKPILNGAVREIPAFTGRVEALAELDRAFALDAPPRVVALRGMPGVGKTATAQHFAWTRRDRFTGCWFIRAQEIETVKQDIAELGGLLDPTLKLEPNLDEAAKRTIAMLDRAGFAKPWLLIFDNAESLDALQPYIPKSSAHVLLTTRNPAHKAGLHAVEIKTLGKDEGIALLRALSGRDRENFDDLFDMLQGLALALVQAGSFLAQNPEVSARTYLGNVEGLLARARRDWPVDQRTAFATFSAAIEKAEHDAPGARSMMQLAAWCAPERVPFELFEQKPKCYPPALARLSQDKTALMEVRQALWRLGLIALNVEDRSFDLHRVTQIVARALQDESDDPAAAPSWPRYRVAAVGALNAAFPGGEGEDDPQDHRSWPRSSRLALHVIEVLGPDSDGQEPVSAGRLANQCGRYFESRADYPAAEQLYRRALAIDERVYGPDHPNVATSLNNLALVQQKIGRLEEAENLYRRALATFERVYGQDHPDVATSLNNLAIVLRDTGRLEEAEKLYRLALAIWERAHGPDHPAVATSLNNLASVLLITGRLEEAEELVRRALAIWERALGPDHPDVAMSLNNLAVVLQKTGRLEEAETLAERACRIAAATLGPDHPNTKLCEENLAGIRADRASAAAPAITHPPELGSPWFWPVIASLSALALGIVIGLIFVFG